MLWSVGLLYHLDVRQFVMLDSDSPVSVQPTPKSLSMGAGVSPVKAPYLGDRATFWALTAVCRNAATRKMDETRASGSGSLARLRVSYVLTDVGANVRLHVVQVDGGRRDHDLHMRRTYMRHGGQVNTRGEMPMAAGPYGLTSAFRGKMPPSFSVFTRAALLARVPFAFQLPPMR